MTDAPETVSIWPHVNDHFNPPTDDWSCGHWDETACGTSYTRTDLIPASEEVIEIADALDAQAARIAVLEAALKTCMIELDTVGGSGWGENTDTVMARARAALASGATDDLPSKDRERG